MTKTDIINYLITTPHNTNKNILNSILAGLDNKNEIIAYALHTPHNMNKKVLERLININDEDSETNIETNAIVDTAIVGSAQVV